MKLMSCSHLATVLLSAALLLPAAAHGQSRTIQVDDLAKITTVSDPQISPDGKSIACILSRVNLEQDRSDRELVLIDIASGVPHVMTHDRKGVGSPRWSPEGDRLAFEAMDAAKEPHLQLFVMPMSGGEAKKITDVPNGVEQFAWRPNGQEIAYVSSDEPENKKEIEKHNDAFEVGDNDYLASGPELPSHLWLIPAEGGKSRRLTQGAWCTRQNRAAQFPGLANQLVRRRKTPALHPPGASAIRRQRSHIAASPDRRLRRDPQDYHSHDARKFWPLFSRTARKSPTGIRATATPTTKTKSSLTDTAAGGDGTIRHARHRSQPVPRNLDA